MGSKQTTHFRFKEVIYSKEKPLFARERQIFFRQKKVS
jgi:hypothetical protein